MNSSLKKNLINLSIFSRESSRDSKLKIRDNSEDKSVLEIKDEDEGGDEGELLLIEISESRDVSKSDEGTIRSSLDR